MILKLTLCRQYHVDLPEPNNRKPARTEAPDALSDDSSTIRIKLFSLPPFITQRTISGSHWTFLVQRI